MRRGRVLVRTPVWTGAVFAYSALMAVLLFPGAVEPAPGEPTWVGPAALPLLIVLALRALVVGVAVTEREVVVRNFLSTRRIARDEVIDIRLVNYSGFIAWQSPSGLSALKSVELRTDRGRVVKAYGLFGTSRAISSRVRRLRAQVGLPVDRQEPRHRVKPS
ncbi:MAG: hypothetical protein KJ792_01030 [Actinobacteria bacterium]|nr:hypothetical protein [Actinomycetota bacterium]